MSAHAPGTTGYAAALADVYDSVSFDDLHRDVAHFFPQTPAFVLDIGAGSGRDAAAFAARGHSVLAVEPVAEFRVPAAARHASPRIEWLDDSLPALARIDACRTFDLVMLTAVWMHLDAGERSQAMPRLAELVRPGGAIVFSLRRGPVPPGRRMFHVEARETQELGARAGLAPALILDERPSMLAAPGVAWSRLVLVRDSA